MLVELPEVLESSSSCSSSSFLKHTLHHASTPVLGIVSTCGHCPVLDPACTALFMEPPEARPSGYGYPVRDLLFRVSGALRFGFLFQWHRLCPSCHHLFQLIVIHHHLQGRVWSPQSILVVWQAQHVVPPPICLGDSTFPSIGLQLLDQLPFSEPDISLADLFCGLRPLPFGGSHLRLPSGPAGIRTTTGSLSALARPTPYQLSHRVA